MYNEFVRHRRVGYFEVFPLNSQAETRINSNYLRGTRRLRALEESQFHSAVVIPQLGNECETEALVGSPS